MSNTYVSDSNREIQENILALLRANGPCDFLQCFRECIIQVPGFNKNDKHLVAGAINELIKDSKIALYDTGDAYEIVNPDLACHYYNQEAKK